MKGNSNSTVVSLLNSHEDSSGALVHFKDGNCHQKDTANKPAEANTNSSNGTKEGIMETDSVESMPTTILCIESENEGKIKRLNFE